MDPALQKAMDDGFAGADATSEVDEDEASVAGGTASAVGKTAFACFGRYHFLFRDVPYKSTADAVAAYKTLRGGDGLPVVIGDHSGLQYLAAIEAIVDVATAAPS